MAREISVDEYTLLEYNSFLGKDKIKLTTLAPEIFESKGFIVYAAQQAAAVGGTLSGQLLGGVSQRTFGAHSRSSYLQRHAGLISQATRDSESAFDLRRNHSGGDRR